MIVIEIASIAIVTVEIVVFGVFSDLEYFEDMGSIEGHETVDLFWVDGELFANPFAGKRLRI